MTPGKFAYKSFELGIAVFCVDCVGLRVFFIAKSTDFHCGDPEFFFKISRDFGY